MSNFVFVVFVVLAIAGFMVLMRFLGQRSQGAQEYLKKPLLTDNEKEFFGRLTEALPDFHVFPQVAMGAILMPAVPRSDKSNYYRIRGTFSQKMVDFVVCDKAFNIVALIELDDRTHSNEKDGKRDAMTTQAGYATLRFSSKKKPSKDEIAKAVEGTKSVGLNPNLIQLAKSNSPKV
ncbi:MAG: DUF2726 domain-containing protein [Sideroxydans sp.]|jgi:hypothetical protein